MMLSISVLCVSTTVDTISTIRIPVALRERLEALVVPLREADPVTRVSVSYVIRLALLRGVELLERKAP